MNRLTFFIVVLLCVAFAGLNIVETYMYRTWVRATTEQRMIDQKVVLSERVHSFAGQFIRRIAADAQTDQALHDILKRHFPMDLNKSKGNAQPVKAAAAPIATPVTNPPHE